METWVELNSLHHKEHIGHASYLVLPALDRELAPRNLRATGPTTFSRSIQRVIPVYTCRREHVIVKTNLSREPSYYYILAASVFARFFVN